MLSELNHTTRLVILIFSIWLFSISFLFHLSLHAQKASSLNGTLVDSETRETLPGAHIIIDGTYSGTITNEDGEFTVDPGFYPVTLIFRFVGYQSKAVVMERPASGLEIRLTPAVFMMEEVVITDEDPAIRIMKRVIERKPIWREKLESWKADAYTRQILSNDEGIISISETYSTSWWHHEQGAREVITDKRQTANILPEQNFAGSSYLPNFYDDQLNISDFQIIGVTHPDALDHYSFRIVKQWEVEDNRIYQLAVSPRRRLQPLFEGTITVLGGEYALLDVNLTPNEAVFFPPPIKDFQLAYQQSFDNYGTDFWLPVDFRVEGQIEIALPGLRFPPILFRQLAAISSYEVNIPVPDSLYRLSRFITTDTTSLQQNIRFSDRPPAIPLSHRESIAYDEIDSTLSFAQAFEPRGFLSRFMNTEQDGGSISVGGGVRSFSGSAGRLGFSFKPDLRYNRVESLYAGLRPEFQTKAGITLEVLAGFSTGQEHVGYGGGISYRFRGYEIGIRHENNAINRTATEHYGRTITSIAPLLGFPDYFDYYHSEKTGVRFIPGFRIAGMKPEIRVLYEHHRSLEKATNYSLPGGFIQRENIPVDEGNLRSIRIDLSTGSSPVPFNVIGGNSLRLSLEHSNRDLFDSDFSFTRLEGQADLRINTFLSRRLLPNTLDVRFRGFVSGGSLPVQRFMGIDGSLTGWTPFGVFRSSPNRRLEGKQGVALFWEHNFRTVPFELIGMRRAVNNGIGLIVAGAHGRTWIDSSTQNQFSGLLLYEDQWRHEAGISINNLFMMMRIDATLRIDRPGFYLGIGLTRYF